jgi:hypothetical protein
LSLAGGSAAGDTAPSSTYGDDEIASSIRELNAALRFSPHPAGAAARHDSLSDSALSSPQQDRVMQRMMDRRRSQATDAPRTTSTAAGTGAGAAAAASGSEVPAEKSPAPNPLDAIPVLVEPGEMAAAQRASSPGRSVTPSGVSDSSAPPHTRTASVAFSASVPQHAPGERKMSLQARYGRARFSRTHSMAGAATDAETDRGEEAAAAGEERGASGGSAESKTGSDSEGQRPEPSHAPPRRAVETVEPELPPHLRRRSLHHPPGAFTLRHAASGAVDGEELDSDAELCDIDDAVRGEHGGAHDHVGSAGFSPVPVPAFLYFPLELTQRDYLRRLFEILGDAVRSPLLQLYQATEHAMSGSLAGSAMGDTPPHAGLFGSPPPHGPSHRHSTGGYLPSTPGTGLHPVDAHAPHYSSFPWQEALKYDCVGLLKLLLDTRFNFKLRPYICAKGTFIPSNDAFSALLRAADRLLEAYLTGVAPLHATGVTYVPQESGQLEEIPHLFTAASTIASSLSNAADKCDGSSGHHGGPEMPRAPESLDQSLRRLVDLQHQLAEHRVYKEQRMRAAGWQWEAAAPDSVQQQHARAGTPMSPVTSRPHSRAASEAASDSASKTATSLGSAQPTRRLSALTTGPRRASLSRSPTSLTVKETAQSESVLVHLYRRSEATVAHLLVAVLPNNIAVIELMVCFSEIHDLLRVYQEHHRRSGHREEAQFLKEFAEALEHQLSMDLSSVGAFKTSQQQQQLGSSAYAPSVVSSQSTSTVGAYFSPNKGVRGLGSPEQRNTSPSSGRLQLTQGIAGAVSDSGRKPLPSSPHGSGRRLPQGAIATEVLDQIYIELDEMAAAVAERESKQQSSGQTAEVTRGLGVAGPPPKGMAGAVPVLKAAKAATQSQKDLKLAAEREAWSFSTAPVEDGSVKQDPVVRIQHRVQSGRYLLEHMRSLMNTSDELIMQLDECRTALVNQRNRDYADVDREITKEQLRRSLNQEEKIGAVIKELTSLSTQVKHKLAPLQLTHNEELCELLSSRGMMGELANKLYSVSLTTVNAGHREHIAMCVATLLIRSKSVALVHSVYKNWPQLTITYAVVNAEQVAAEAPERVNSSAAVSTPVAALNRSISAGYRAPYSLDFASPTGSRGKSPAAPAPVLSPRTGGTGSVASARAQPPQVLNVEYVTQPASEVDVYDSLDFGSTRSLRLLGFTLTQMRHSKCFDLKDLLAAGFPLSEVKNLKSSLYVNISAKDLRLAGYTAHEVRVSIMQ